MYEKYCDGCIKRYGVKQDNSWHKNHHFDNWDVDRKEEFEKDIAAVSVFHVSPNVEPETIRALSEAMILAVENATKQPLVGGRKARKRHRKTFPNQRSSVAIMENITIEEIELTLTIIDQWEREFRVSGKSWDDVNALKDKLERMKESLLPQSVGKT